MVCTKCESTSFKRDHCEYCGKHKDRPVFRVGTKSANRRMKKGS